MADKSSSIETRHQSPRKVSSTGIMLKSLLGLVLAVIFALWIGHAWAIRNTVGLVAGTFSLLCVIAAVTFSQRATIDHHLYQPPDESDKRRDRALPYLGELLLFKYHYINEKQLREALREQRNRGGRLGQILVAMNLIDYEKLSAVLEDQLSYGDPWRELGEKFKQDSVPAKTS